MVKPSGQNHPHSQCLAYNETPNFTEILFGNTSSENAVTISDFPLLVMITAFPKEEVCVWKKELIKSLEKGKIYFTSLISIIIVVGFFLITLTWKKQQPYRFLLTNA